MNFNLKYQKFNFCRKFGIFDYIIYNTTQFITGFYIFKNFSFFFSKYSTYFRNIQLLTKFSENPQFTYSLKIYVIRFYLKGIGYKFLQSKKIKKFLKIELGHSVSTYFSISPAIKLFHKRDKLIMLSFDRAHLINFSKQIFHLRPADVYKGKGVRLATLPYLVFKAGKQR